MMQIGWFPRLRQGRFLTTTDNATDETFVTLSVRPESVTVDPTTGVVWTYEINRFGKTGLSCSIAWEMLLGSGITSAAFVGGQAFSGTASFASGETRKVIQFQALGTQGADVSAVFQLATPVNCTLSGTTSVQTLINRTETPVSSEGWPDPPALLLSGLPGRVNVTTGTALQAAFDAATAATQIVLTSDITTSLVLTYDTTAGEQTPVVLRGNSDSVDPANWPELKNATLRVVGSRLIVTKLRLNNVKIFLGNASPTATRYLRNRVTRCWHYGITGAGKRDSAITVQCGCRNIRIDRNHFGKYGTVGHHGYGILGDQGALPTKLIEDILPVGYTARTAYPRDPQSGSIAAPLQNNYSTDIEVDYNRFDTIERLTSAASGAYGMFTGQDNGESHLPSAWDIHHNLFRNMVGSGTRPWIEHKNSYSSIHHNTFERTSTTYLPGVLRLRHGDHNTVEANLFVARGDYSASELQVRGEGQRLINNRSLKTVGSQLVQGSDKIVIYGGGLDAIYWPTKTGQSTGDSSYQIGAMRCHVGGNSLRVEYGEWNTGSAGQMGVPSREHQIGPATGTSASRNYAVAAASDTVAGENYTGVSTNATVTGASYGLTLTPLSIADVGINAP